MVSSAPQLKLSLSLHNYRPALEGGSAVSTHGHVGKSCRGHSQQIQQETGVEMGVPGVSQSGDLSTKDSLSPGRFSYLHQLLSSLPCRTFTFTFVYCLPSSHHLTSRFLSLLLFHWFSSCLARIVQKKPQNLASRKSGFKTQLPSFQVGKCWYIEEGCVSQIPLWDLRSQRSQGFICVETLQDLQCHKAAMQSEQSLCSPSHVGMCAWKYLYIWVRIWVHSVGLLLHEGASACPCAHLS